MSGSELSDRVAKALMDIQDAANLIVLDLITAGSPAGASTRFAAIQQYAMRAMEDLSVLEPEGKLEMPVELRDMLRMRCA